MTTHLVIRALLVSLVCVASAAGRDDTLPSAHPLPLDDLGRGLYAGFEGGLYPHGLNMPPGRHHAAALEQAALVRPLDVAGADDPVDGRIVLLTLGGPNGRLVSEPFLKLVAADGARDPALVVVDGAVATDLAALADPDDASWTRVRRQLTTAGLSRAQVQVVWLDATTAPSSLPFPGNALALREPLADIVDLVRTQLPNVRLLYLSSGAYAGFGAGASGARDSFEAGFAVKWLIEDQLAQPDAPATPWLGWGPYLWADAASPRSDGLVAQRGDFSLDGLHWSNQGAATIAERLLRFVHVDAAARTWYGAGAPAACSEEALVSFFGLDRVGEDAPAIAVSALPVLESEETLWVSVTGAPPSAPGLFLGAIGPAGGALTASGPLLIAPDFARMVATETDANGRAWLRLGPVLSDHAELCGLSLSLQFVAAGEDKLVASPGVRLQGGH